MRAPPCSFEDEIFFFYPRFLPFHNIFHRKTVSRSSLPPPFIIQNIYIYIFSYRRRLPSAYFKCVFVFRRGFCRGGIFFSTYIDWTFYIRVRLNPHPLFASSILHQFFLSLFELPMQNLAHLQNYTICNFKYKHLKNEIKLSQCN